MHEKKTWKVREVEKMAHIYMQATKKVNVFFSKLPVQGKKSRQPIYSKSEHKKYQLQSIYLSKSEKLT